jgi:hypothetical protein
MLLCEVIGFPLASVKESGCGGPRLHQGFLHNLTQVTLPSLSPSLSPSPLLIVL